MELLFWENLHSVTAIAPVSLQPLRAHAAAVSSLPQPVGVTRAEVLTTTESAVDDITASIDAATQTVDAEFFALLPDGPGATIVDALERAARRGVQVHLTLDGLGNAMVGLGSSMHFSISADRDMLHRLQVAGAQVHRAWRWSPRAASRATDHRKVVAVDGKVAYLGGMNFGKSTAGWADAMVRASGPLAGMVGAEQARRWSSFDATNVLATRGAQATIDAVDGYRLLRTAPDVHGTEILDWYLARIAAATSRVWVASPALFDRQVVGALADAARRGVDVRYFAPGQTLAGIPMLHTMIRAASAPLVDAGAAVYEMNGFSHLKAMLVDDEATVGSFNITGRSAKHDHELNVASGDPAFTSQVEQMLLGIQARSHASAPLHGVEKPLAWAMRATHFQY